MNNDQKCPNVETLKSLLADALPREEQTALASHLELCAQCRKTMEELVGGDILPGYDESATEAVTVNGRGTISGREYPLQLASGDYPVEVCVQVMTLAIMRSRPNFWCANRRPSPQISSYIPVRSRNLSLTRIGLSSGGTGIDRRGIQEKQDEEGE